MSTSSRYAAQRQQELAGSSGRRMKGMLSRRELVTDASDGQRVTARGREADDGSFESDEMDVFGTIGIVGRPADDATVEELVALVGADGAHPVAVAQLDYGRVAVINAVGLKADEVIVYNSKSVVKLLADGTIELRSLAGTAKSVAFHDELQAVNARITSLETAYNGHLHPYIPGPGTGTVPSGPTTTPSSTSASVVGSQKVRLE